MSKYRVTTNLPNRPALKMDGAEVIDLNSAVYNWNANSIRVGGRVVGEKILSVRIDESDNSADLGGSSNDSIEIH